MLTRIPTKNDVEVKIDNTNIKSIDPIVNPAVLLQKYDGASVANFVYESRQRVANIIQQQDDRLLLIIGPCSIHDPAAAIEYAKRLKPLCEQYKDTLEVVMRVYFEKPRTSIGWKGLINDPKLNNQCDPELGLELARKVLLEIQKIGVPAATEFLDVISPQYIADLMSWGAIGARTTESQLHRELSSGLSMPVGFKNGTDGNIKIAIDAITSASNPHTFLGATKDGKIGIVHTKGNQNCHIILRGGKTTNYDLASIKDAYQQLTAAKLSPAVMVDCSHGNSQKKHSNQILVAQEIADQISNGLSYVSGLMVESNLTAGAQKFTPGKDDPQQLVYGQSITDACVGWEESLEFFAILDRAVKQRRRLKRLDAKIA